MKKKEDKYKVSAVVVTKNEEKKIAGCLESIKWMDEIVLVDDRSTDRTVEIAKKFKVKMVSKKSSNFSIRRNIGTKKTSGDWVLHIDADERMTPELKKEILKIVNTPKNKFTSYAIPRRNYIFGKEMKHCGLWPDYVEHFFKRSAFVSWKGALHETPIVKGKMGYLKYPLIHLKHDFLSEMVKKTNKWSEVEAELLFEANHPKMKWWRFIRIMLTEFYLRMIKQRAFLDGGEGVIYAFYQVWSRFLTYAKLYEMQIKEGKGK